MQYQKTLPALPAGLLVLSLRVVTGWTYFSAFWRRLVLENKLDPDAQGYIGEKFNHFLPQALGIKSVIRYLVTHPDLLWWAMVLFTVAEAVVGLCFMLGLFTRWMSVFVMSLAFGILLGAGWLGTTCLDEWQIGVLGIAAGFTVFASGAGPVSLDHAISRNRQKEKLSFFYSQTLPLLNRRIIIAGTLLITALTLFTNQYFHGGVWGTLHNKSVKPLLEISNAAIREDGLSFDLGRTEGADVYGSFLIGVQLEKANGEIIYKRSSADLAELPLSAITNHYVAKIKPGKHSLLIPLGAKASIVFRDASLKLIPSTTYRLRLTDISGLEWSAVIIKKE